MKRSILCVSDYFLPGFKGGGPIRTLVNLRALLGDDMELAIFTRDRDLGSSSTYADVRPNGWTQTEQGPVFYADPAKFGPEGVRQALRRGDFDLLYLNSFFSARGSILLVLARRFSLQSSPLRLPVLLAPRGEFSPGALALKGGKKRLFLAFARWLGLHRDIHWHASTAAEAEDILRHFPEANARIHLAVDPVIIDAGPADAAPPTVPEHLRLAFISRISPMKNLDGLLRILAGVQAPTDLSIYGPIEDEAHWQQCQALIARLPGHIRVTLHGPLDPEAVSQVFAQHDLFAFPTHGENFGHVIFEALRAGTPVLVSDRTPWQSTTSGALTVLPLADTEGWRRALDAAAARTVEERLSLRRETVAYARSYAANSGTRDDNIHMFRAVIGDRRPKDTR